MKKRLKKTWSNSNGGRGHILAHITHRHRRSLTLETECACQCVNKVPKCNSFFFRIRKTYNSGLCGLMYSGGICGRGVMFSFLISFCFRCVFSGVMWFCYTVEVDAMFVWLANFFVFT